MTYFYEELIIILMGAFVCFSAKKCKIYPIPIWTEIGGILLALGIIYIIHYFCRDISIFAFREYCRFALLGYLPVRVVCWLKRISKNEC